VGCRGKMWGVIQNLKPAYFNSTGLYRGLRKKFKFQIHKAVDTKIIQVQGFIKQYSSIIKNTLSYGVKPKSEETLR